MFILFVRWLGSEEQVLPEIDITKEYGNIKNKRDYVGLKIFAFSISFNLDFI